VRARGRRGARRQPPPASEEVRNTPKKGGELKANERLVTIRTKDPRAGIPSLLPVTCRGATLGYVVALAAADGLTARPNNDSVTVFPPKRTPSGTQTLHAICQN
jgi:hypothetical protein